MRTWERTWHLIFLAHIWALSPFAFLWLQNPQVARDLAPESMRDMRAFTIGVLAYFLIRTVLAFKDPKWLRWQYVYPPIDVDKGGSINGEIDALNKLIDMSVTEFMAQGGTLIVPGRGWISDAADVGYYRDMLMVIRDRIKAMTDKGLTLAQVKAAKPTMDFDPEYGREPGVASRFVEAVYRSLKH